MVYHHNSEHTTLTQSVLKELTWDWLNLQLCGKRITEVAAVARKKLVRRPLPLGLQCMDDSFDLQKQDQAPMSQNGTE